MIAAAQSHLDAIDAQVSKRSLLLHPFYQAWTAGELTMEALQDYSRQYYHHVLAFPTYISAIHCHTDDAATRRHLVENLMEEEGGEVNHPELWLRFVEGLGIERSSAEEADVWPEIENLISTYRSICRDRSAVEGLAALYAYESQVPGIAISKIDGLRRFYGINDRESLSYFDVHIEADREHSADERALLESQVDAGNSGAVTKSVDDALDALWEALNGVCRRHDISLASRVAASSAIGSSLSN